jgi:ATP-binding cassette subfamily B protein RaxB
VLSPNEVLGKVALTEPAYRITVRLDRQDIDAFGRSVPLQPDMTLKADIVLEGRSLAAWLFEPLISVRGADVKLFASLDYFGAPRLPAIIQSEASECDIAALRRLFSISLKGVTLKDVLVMGQRLGMTGRGLRLEPEQLGRIKLPCILHWDMNHLVVLKHVGTRKVTIHDPAFGIRTLTLDEVGRHFTGIALEPTPTSAFERRKETSRLSLIALWGGMRGIKPALAQALVLSMVLQLVVLAAPFYMQLAVDEAVMKGDQGLLTALALGFGLLTLIHISAEWLRSHVLLFLGGALNFQMGANCSTISCGFP